MTALSDLQDLAKRAAIRRLPDGFVERVLVESMVGADGHDALGVVIVITGDVETGLDGDRALDTLVEVSQAFQKAGEARSPMIRYMREDELSEHGDPES